MPNSDADIVGLLYNGSYYHRQCYPWIKGRPEIIPRGVANKYGLYCIACGELLVKEESRGVNTTTQEISSP